MNQMSIKLQFIFAGILIIIFFILALFPLSREKNNVIENIPTQNPLPTAFEQKEEIIMPEFTGVRKEPIPQEFISTSAQEAVLKKILPIQEDTFVLSFDYAGDIFSVSLEQPKEASKISFEEWLNKNYSLIPLTRFSFY